MTRFRTTLLFAALLAGPSLSHAQDALPQDDPQSKAKALKQRQLKQQARQGAALERFLALPPRQQQRLLQQMTPERRRQAQQLLQAWDLLSEDERNSLRGRVESFASLPQPRRQAVRNEIQILRRMTPEDRRKRLADIKSRFSEDEMQILNGVAGQPAQQEEE